MSNLLGNKYRVHVFGQSHSEAIGAVIEGIPAGVVPDMARIGAFMYESLTIVRRIIAASAAVIRPSRFASPFFSVTRSIRIFSNDAFSKYAGAK